MKYTLITSSLLALGLAHTIPSSARPHARKSLSKRIPEPVCKFNGHTSDDTGSWKTSPNAKRDLNATTWDPPSNLVTALGEVWNHEMATYSDPLGFKNYGYDQVIAGKGKINYCVRWDSAKTVTADQRTQVETAIVRSFNKWIEVLAGFDGFPYESVDVSVVGWAVRDTSLLKGDTSGIDVYTTKDAEGTPQCDEGCGRFFHQNNDYSQCAAGKDRHYGKPSPNSRKYMPIR